MGAAQKRRSGKREEVTDIRNSVDIKRGQILSWGLAISSGEIANHIILMVYNAALVVRLMQASRGRMYSGEVGNAAVLQQM